jgi:tetratricopeptide (TPR) repeat protein
MTVAPLLLAQPAAPYAPACEPTAVSKTDAARAHTVFLSGKQYLDESNYDKAIRYFLDAYAIDCSVHGILRAIASAYERKADKAAAIDALERYLERAPNASDREVVERRIKNLRDQLEHEGPSAAPLVAAPTPHHQEPMPVVLASGFAPPASTKASPSPTLAPWILGGLGGAAAVAGGVLAVVGASDVSSAASRCSSRVHCAPDVAEQGNWGRTLEQAAAVIVASGVAVLAASVLWRILDASRAEAAPSPAMVVVGPHGYAGVAVDVTF